MARARVLLRDTSGLPRELLLTVRAARRLVLAVAGLLLALQLVVDVSSWSWSLLGPHELATQLESARPVLWLLRALDREVDG